jgi:hypothetical protein
MQNICPQQISIYTTMKILLSIRRSQGLESMLEFMEKYTLAAERTTPDLKQILAESLEEKCVETFYKSVTTLKEGGEG